ncbi:hypothetical protein [Arthrobacter psychrolactophilus]
MSGKTVVMERDAGTAGLWEDKLRITVLAIGVVTVISGATQAVAPRFVLGMIGAEQSATSAQLFATVGAFMVVVGGALTHATLRGSELEVVLFWFTVQKIMAVAAVCLGVAAGVFGPRALSVAAFDLISAGFLAAYALRVRRRQSESGQPSRGDTEPGEVSRP